MKKGILKFYPIGVIAAVIFFAGCTTSQYGYDDVYDDNYPVYATMGKDRGANSNASGSTENNSGGYQEDDYMNYDQGYSAGSYSSRIDRFYGPSISFGYYSGFYSPSWYGGIGFGYGTYPYYGYNPWYYDPYYYHVHHYHSPIYWYDPWYGNPPYYYNPWYGYNYNCPPYYGYGGYYGGYYPPSTYSPYYGPRPNYQAGGSVQYNRNSTTITNPLNPNIKTTTFDNGVKVRSTVKDSPDQLNIPKENTSPNPAVEPQSVPRPRNHPKPQAIPKPGYTSPAISQPNHPKPRFETQPRHDTPRPSPSYSQPKPSPSVTPQIKPKTNSNVNP